MDFKNNMAAVNISINMLVGDQSNYKHLHGWIQESGGQFDVIIDDGVHSNEHIYNSLVILFQHALLPGGLYVIEDLYGTRKASRKPKNNSVIDVLKDWVEQLLTWPAQGREQDAAVAYKPKYRLMPRIKSIEFFSVACVLIKCYKDDESCMYGTYEQALLPTW